MHDNDWIPTFLAFRKISRAAFLSFAFPCIVVAFKDPENSLQRVASMTAEKLLSQLYVATTCSMFINARVLVTHSWKLRLISTPGTFCIL